MGFRLPLKSLLRDIVVMCCGSILGLLLAKTFAGDSTRDRCSAIHIVKRNDGSWQVVAIEGRSNISQNYSGDEGRGGERDNVGSDDTMSGWMEEMAWEEEEEDIFVPNEATVGKLIYC